MPQGGKLNTADKQLIQGLYRTGPFSHPTSGIRGGDPEARSRENHCGRSQLVVFQETCKTPPSGGREQRSGTDGNR